MGVKIDAQRHIETNLGDKLEALDSSDSEYVKAIYE